MAVEHQEFAGVRPAAIRRYLRDYRNNKIVDASDLTTDEFAQTLDVFKSKRVELFNDLYKPFMAALKSIRETIFNPRTRFII